MQSLIIMENEDDSFIIVFMARVLNAHKLFRNLPRNLPHHSHFMMSEELRNSYREIVREHPDSHNYSILGMHRMNQIRGIIAEMEKIIAMETHPRIKFSSRIFENLHKPWWIRAKRAWEQYATMMEDFLREGQSSLSDKILFLASSDPNAFWSVLWEWIAQDYFREIGTDFLCEHIVNLIFLRPDGDYQRNVAQVEFERMLNNKNPDIQFLNSDAATMVMQKMDFMVYPSRKMLGADTVSYFGL